MVGPSENVRGLPEACLTFSAGTVVCISTCSYHLQPMFETARMYKGYVGNVRIEDTYGITCFELG
jgi:hypothetical protein